MEAGALRYYFDDFVFKLYIKKSAAAGGNDYAVFRTTQKTRTTRTRLLWGNGRNEEIPEDMSCLVKLN